MPERDPDEILEAFADLTERVPRPSPLASRPGHLPAFAGAGAILGVVVVLVAGLAAVYGPHLLPGRPPASAAETGSTPTLHGYVSGTWRLGPGAIVTPKSTRIDVLLTETECANGMSPEGRIGPPEVAYDGSAVVVTLSVRPIYGDCPSNPDYPLTVELSEPVGNRQLVDGSNNDIEWQLRPGLIELRHHFEPGVNCYPTYLEDAQLDGDAADPARLWVRGDEGQRVDVLWPIGYGAVFDGEVELVGANGATVASRGTVLTLAGGFLPTGEFAACEVLVGRSAIAGDPLPWPSAEPTPHDGPTASPPPATISPRGDLVGVLVRASEEGGCGFLVDDEGQTWELHWPHFVFVEGGAEPVLQDPTQFIAVKGARLWLQGHTGEEARCGGDLVFHAEQIVKVEPTAEQSPKDRAVTTALTDPLLVDYASGHAQRVLTVTRYEGEAMPPGLLVKLQFEGLGREWPLGSCDIYRPDERTIGIKWLISPDGGQIQARSPIWVGGIDCLF